MSVSSKYISYTDPSGITFEWTMELSYEEGNYEDFADSVSLASTVPINVLIRYVLPSFVDFLRVLKK